MGWEGKTQILKEIQTDKRCQWCFFFNRCQLCFLTDEKTVGHREVAKFMLHNREAVGWEGNTQILKEMQTEKRR